MTTRRLSLDEFAAAALPSVLKNIAESPEVIRIMDKAKASGLQLQELSNILSQGAAKGAFEVAEAMLVESERRHQDTKQSDLKLG